MSEFYLFNDSTEKVKKIDSESISKISNGDVISDSEFSVNSKKYRLFNIATVSDKVINRRIYPDKAVRATVSNFRWLTPYYKPFLTNHDIYSIPLGRVVDNFYYNHLSDSIEGGHSTIPQKVLDNLKAANLFDKGTGSVMLEIKATDSCISKIKDGIFLTTSQSSATDSFTCSVCGKDIYDCEHVPGETYDKEVCSAMTGDLFPVEVSAVNRPANQSSVLVLYNKIEDSVEFFNFFKPETYTEEKETEDSTLKGTGGTIVSVEHTANEPEKVPQAEIKSNNKGVSMEQKKLLKLADSLKKKMTSDLLKRLDISDANTTDEVKNIVDAFELSELHNVNDLIEFMSSKYIVLYEGRKQLIADAVNPSIHLIKIEDKEEVEVEMVEVVEIKKENKEKLVPDFLEVKDENKKDAFGFKAGLLF